LPDLVIAMLLLAVEAQPRSRGSRTVEDRHRASRGHQRDWIAPGRCPELLDGLFLTEELDLLVAQRMHRKRRTRPPCVVTTPKAKDPEWIPVVANQGWIAITRDSNILDHLSAL
jgi:hypothetical protein